MSIQVNKRIVVLIVAVMAIVAGCGGGSDVAAKIVTPEHSQVSPSGTYTAVAQEGSEVNGEKPWTVVVRDKAGNEVFHDHASYGTGVMITWLPSEPEQLWVYSGDDGIYRITPGKQGGWTRAGVKTENVPSEISTLWESRRS